MFSEWNPFPCHWAHQAGCTLRLHRRFPLQQEWPLGMPIPWLHRCSACHCSHCCLHRYANWSLSTQVSHFCFARWTERTEIFCFVGCLSLEVLAEALASCLTTWWSCCRLARLSRSPRGCKCGWLSYDCAVLLGMCSSSSFKCCQDLCSFARSISLFQTFATELICLEDLVNLANTHFNVCLREAGLINYSSYLFLG